jgi:hypothetical protein
MKLGYLIMLSVKDSIVLEWKTVSLPIHREEELVFALSHVSYYDSPFSSSYEERKAYYGEDWHHFTGETLETLCLLPDAFTPEKKADLLREYRAMIEYAESTLDKLTLNVPRFLNATLDEAERYLKLYGYSSELLAIHSCTEDQKRLLLYCYKKRMQEKETREIDAVFKSLEDKYGDILPLAIQQYKLEECLHQLRIQLDKLPALKDRL